MELGDVTVGSQIKFDDHDTIYTVTDGRINGRIVLVYDNHLVLFSYPHIDVIPVKLNDKMMKLRNVEPLTEVKFDDTIYFVGRHSYYVGDKRMIMLESEDDGLPVDEDECVEIMTRNYSG
jgi:hypothetical protein